MQKIIPSIKRLLTKLKKPSLKVRQPNLQQEDTFQEVFPTGDLQGCLDSPQVNAASLNGILPVRGWLFSRNSRIISIRLVVNNLPEQQIVYGVTRPDVAQVFPEVLNAGLSGFAWNLPLNQNSASLEIKLWAILENGERICCFARRVNVDSTASPTPSQRTINLNLFVRSVIVKAWLVAKQGKVPLSPVVWVKKIRRYYKQLESYQSGSTSSQPLNLIHPWQTEEPYQRWIETNSLTPKLLAQLRKNANQLKNRGAKISIVVPVYNPPRRFLQEMIASVTCQIYPNWELCLADDASTEPHVKEILEQAQREDARIKVIFRPENGHIVEATNSALEIATGEFVALLDHDDRLPMDALLQVAECIDNNPDLDWIYTDEDKIDQDGCRYDPQMKGEWSPEMAITHNYTHHLSVFRRTVIDKIGRLRKGFEGAQDLDLFLRVAENTTPDKIRHIAKVCYHWRCHAQSTASRGTQKRYIFDSAARAIAESIQRRGLRAKPFLPAIAEKHGLCLYQLKWDESLLAENPVTIVIPTRDRVELLGNCISSLVKTVDCRFVKLIIVDDGSTEAKTHEYFQKLQAEEVLQCRVIPSGRTDSPFNYARLVNLGAEYVDTPYMLHLNNDIEAIASGWLEEMVGWMSIEEVEIVGAKLLYPDQTIQHAGVVIGPHDGLADHLFHQLHKDEVGYICLPHAARNVSAVTGACLLTSTALYRELGGFDTEKFAVQYNDVDYCLRVNQLGKRVVYTPQATLIHLTSASRGKDYDYTEHLNFIQKYPHFKDRFFNENLEINSMSMAVNPSYFSYRNSLKNLPLNILFVSHNLNFEGAPLMAYRFAKFFAEQEGCKVTVISAEDGLLGAEYEKLNIPVKIIPESVVPIQENIQQYRQRLKKLGQSLDISRFNLVISNTIIACWGVELANLFGLPSIWHIHESSPIEKSLCNFFGMSPPDCMEALLRDCFINASRVIFVADATRNIFHNLDLRGSFRTIPGGIDVEVIDRFRAAHTKSELRLKHDINPHDIVITIIGTTCERKGQHIFLEAADKLKGIPHLSFLIVGAREGTYLTYLKHQVSQLKLDNVRIIPETREVYDFFALSDIFVCASFEESFPRVILEAMAFELKIVSTNVFGIPEMLANREDSYLVEAGNPDLLAEAIKTCIDEAEFSNRLAKNAYTKVWRKFDNQKMLQKHWQLAQEVAVLSSSVNLERGR